MFNLDKLNAQISNIKDLDPVSLVKILKEHQGSIIKSALIIGALFMMGLMFNDHRIRSEALRTQMSQAVEKMQALKARDKAARDLDDFKSSLPKKINESELIALVSNYAKSHHVTIASLSPAESKDMGLYDDIVLSFNASSDNFKSMMFFLRKIERSGFPLRVDSWSGHEEDDGKITFSVQISAVLIHI